MKKLIWAGFIVITIMYSSFAAEYCSDRGSWLIGGRASYANTSDKGASNSVTQLMLAPELEYFFLPHFFIGPSFGLATVSVAGVSETNLGFGANGGFAYGNQSSVAIPYCGLGFQFLSYSNSLSSESGSSLSIFAGILVPVKKNFGMTIQAEYDEQEEGGLSAHVLGVSLGFIGIIYGASDI